jgi:hypothetical protein
MSSDKTRRICQLNKTLHTQLRNPGNARAHLIITWQQAQSLKLWLIITICFLFITEIQFLQGKKAPLNATQHFWLMTRTDFQFEVCVKFLSKKHHSKLVSSIYFLHYIYIYRGGPESWRGQQQLPKNPNCRRRRRRRTNNPLHKTAFLLHARL